MSQASNCKLLYRRPFSFPGDVKPIAQTKKRIQFLSATLHIQKNHTQDGQLEEVYCCCAPGRGTLLLRPMVTLCHGIVYP